MRSILAVAFTWLTLSAFGQSAPSIAVAIIVWQDSLYDPPLSLSSLLKTPQYLPLSPMQCEKDITTIANNVLPSQFENGRVVLQHQWQPKPEQKQYNWCQSEQTQPNPSILSILYNEKTKTLEGNVVLASGDRSRHIEIEKVTLTKEPWIYLDHHHYGIVIHHTSN